MRTPATFLLFLFWGIGIASEVCAQGLQTLYVFPGGDGGQFPRAAPVEDKRGNLFGTTYGQAFPGSRGKRCSKSCGNGYGLIEGTNVVYSFNSKHGRTPPAFPEAGLVLDKSGNLYGTSNFGGIADLGTVFMINPRKGKVTVLYSFTGIDDGACPLSPLTFDANGNLYGTTAGTNGLGGSYCSAGPPIAGNVFRLSPPASGDGPWMETILFTFGSDSVSPEGALPYGHLVFDTAGNLYGTTAYGGYIDREDYNGGVVFELSPPSIDGDPWTETLLHTFGTPGASEGGRPWSGLIMGLDGSLYGTTYLGGDDGIDGTVFRLNKAKGWQYETLYSFCQITGVPNCADGSGPISPSGLVFDKEGNLYGTTIYGGIGYGTLFKLSPPHRRDACLYWCLTTLYSFSAGSDGANPIDGVILDTKTRTLYGVAEYGGLQPGGCCGTVFEFNLNGAPDVKE